MDCLGDIRIIPQRVNVLRVYILFFFSFSLVAVRQRCALTPMVPDYTYNQLFFEEMCQ